MSNGIMETSVIPPSAVEPLNLTTREIIQRQAVEFKKQYVLKEIAMKVEAERKFQDEKWGPIDQHGHSIAEWVLIAEAELAEAKNAVIKGGAGRNSVRAEIIQTMAVLQACLEQHGIEDDHDGRQL